MSAADHYLYSGIVVCVLAWEALIGRGQRYLRGFFGPAACMKAIRSSSSTTAVSRPP